VDAHEASTVLGVSEFDAADVVRARYRSLLFSSHPDVGGSHDAVRQVIEAFRVLELRPAEPTLPSLPAETDDVGDDLAEFVWRVDDGTIAAALPADEFYVRLLEVGHQIGAVTYVDRQCSVLEILLRTTIGTTVSMLVSLQGRAKGTDAFVSIEPIDAVRGELPSLFDLTELIAHLLRR
jgi:hypothetical protein